MNILLVNPPSNKVLLPGVNLYPFSLLYLSSYLYKNDYRAKILDLSSCEHPRLELIKYIKDKSIDIIGFTSKTEVRFLVWDFIVDTRKIFPNILIVVGGTHFGYTAQETLETISEIDIVVRGEGEISFLEIVKTYESKGNLSNILGISYKENGKIIHNPDRPYEKNIDKFIIDDNVYKDVISPNSDSYSPFVTLRNFRHEKIKAITIHIGRGCPGRCVYCINPSVQYRTRSVDSVIEEIKRKIKKYNCNSFNLEDPHLLKRIGFVKKLCNGLIEEKLKINWYAETRADINFEIINLMKEAGCVSLDFGLESASERVQKSIKKAINVKDVGNLIKKCAQAGIRVRLFTMISLPDEKEVDALKTLNFLKSFSPYLASFTRAVTKIYPGTELELMAKERGILKEDFLWYDRNYQNALPQYSVGQVPQWIEHLSPEFITYYINKVQLIKYSLIKTIKRKIYSFMFEYSFKRKLKRIRSLFSLDWYKLKIIKQLNKWKVRLRKCQ